MKIKNILINSACLVGIGAAGYFVGRKTSKPKTVYAGSLWVDESEPNGQPALYLELNADVNEVTKANVIQLKVMRKK